MPSLFKREARGDLTTQTEEEKGTVTIKQQEAGESREAVSAEGGAVSQGQQATQFWKLEMARKQSPPECLALTTWCSQRSEDVSRLMTSGTVRAHTHTQLMPPSLGKFVTAASGNAHAVPHCALVLSRHTTLTSAGFCRPLL